MIEKFSDEELKTTWFDECLEMEVPIVQSKEYIEALDMPSDEEGYYLDAFNNRIQYDGIPTLKNTNVQHSLTHFHVAEIIKCTSDFKYFYTNYIYITTKKGPDRPELLEYQIKAQNVLLSEKRLLISQPRQSGKTTIVASYILWRITFYPDSSWGIAANLKDTAMKVLADIQSMYKYLPIWLKQGIETWNKGSIKLENGSVVRTSATNGDSFRGYSFVGEGSGVYIDECAFIKPKLWFEFVDSIVPTVSSDPNAQIIMSSTPKGLNHWFDLHKDSKEGNSTYTLFETSWKELLVAREDPEAFKLQVIDDEGEQYFMQNYELSFLGSSNTLIDVNLLSKLKGKKPKYHTDTIRKYEEPDLNSDYIVTVDVSRGKGLDYSVITVIRIGQDTFTQALVYHSNEVSPFALPYVVYKIAREYNDAMVVIENNDLGEGVANQLAVDLDYENVIRGRKNRKGQYVPSLYGKEMGIKMTMTVKRKGCANLKMLLENRQLLLNDRETIEELKRFVPNDKGSYEAERGYHDDLVMTLVMLSWFVFEYNVFKDSEFKKRLEEDSLKEIEENILPIFSNSLINESTSIGVTTITNTDMNFDTDDLKGFF